MNSVQGKEIVRNSNEIYVRGIATNVSELATSLDDIPINAIRKGYENSKLYKKFVESESKRVKQSPKLMKEENDGIKFKDTLKSPSKRGASNTRNEKFTALVNTEYKEGEYNLIKERTALLIRQLTNQLEYQLRRNKDLEIAIRGQAQKTTMIIEELRRHAEEEITELNSKLEKNEQTNKQLQLLIKQQESILNSDRHVIKDSMRKSISKETVEEGIMLREEIDRLRDELIAYKEISDKVKNELVEKKCEVEEENKKLMSKVRASEMELNKIEQEKTNLIRTVNSLNSAKGIIEAGAEELKKENLELKQTIIELEKEEASLNIKLDKVDRDYKTLKLELVKADNIIKLQAETIKELQKDYSDLLNREESYSMLPVRKVKGVLNNTMDDERFENSIKKESRLQTGNERRSRITDYEQEDIKARYEEYRQRQSVSTLMDLPNKRNTSCYRAYNCKRQYSKSRSPEKEYKKQNTSHDYGMPSDKLYADNKEQIDKLQSKLQMLLAEKIRLDKEFSKFGNKPERSIVQKKRKEELEFELDLNEKNVQRVKFRLRELNAFTN